MCIRDRHGGEHVQQIDQGLNGMIYVFGGTVYLNGRPVQDGQLGLMTDGDEVLLEARDGDAEFLILAGPELNEPIARYGPFVMNTREEIHQAIQDFQNGTLA